jgi:hypothetical protein
MRQAAAIVHAVNRWLLALRTEKIDGQHCGVYRLYFP